MKKRLLYYLASFCLLVMINFFLPRLLPGNPLLAIYGDDPMLQMNESVKGELSRQYQLDQSPGRQFLSYLGRLSRLDLGTSYYHKVPVSSLILSHLPWTIGLMAMALPSAMFMGIWLGIVSAWRRGRYTDRFLLAANVILSAIPVFLLAALLLIFLAVQSRLFPLQGGGTPYADFGIIGQVLDRVKHAAMPLAALVLGFIPGYYLLTRNTMVTIIKEPFILTAWAKGLTGRQIQYRHAGRNSLIPAVTATGIHAGTRLVTGALLIEIVFAYPGMGLLLSQALQNRDYPLIQGILLVTALLLLLINLMLGTLFPKLDPRMADHHEIY